MTNDKIKQWNLINIHLTKASEFIEQSKLINFFLFIENNEFGLAFTELYESSGNIDSLAFWELLYESAQLMELKEYQNDVMVKITNLNSKNKKMHYNNLNTTIDEIKSKLNGGYKFNINEHLKVLELLKDCKNDLEASRIISIIGRISWNRKTIEKEIIDQVFNYVTSEVCVSFGTLAIAEGVSWIFSQWVDAGFDTIDEYYWKYRDYLLGVGDDNLYTIQPIAISAAGNYLKLNKHKYILWYLLTFIEEIKYYDSDFVCHHKYEQEKLVLNQHFEFRYKDSIDALKVAFNLPNDTEDKVVIEKARERLVNE